MRRVRTNHFISSKEYYDLQSENLRLLKEIAQLREKVKELEREKETEKEN